MAYRQQEEEWELEYETPGVGQMEMEGELEGEYEGEEFLGTIVRGVGSLLGGQGEGEFETANEFEYEFESEYESEEFLRRLRGIAQGVGNFVRRNAPALRQVARVAAPWVGRAVGALGGPVGSLVGGQLGNLAAQALREGEFEFEMEGEFESEFEGEFEFEAGGPVNDQEAVAEYMAALATRAQSEAEAEAMIGAATATIINRTDRRAIRSVLPHLTRGAAILTRILRRRRATRPAVRAVPTIVRRTATSLARRAASGQPVSARLAARTMAEQTSRVLSNPRTCASAINRNVRASATASRSRRVAAQGSNRPVRG
jgi:hypothetical protein